MPARKVGRPKKRTTTMRGGSFKDVMKKIFNFVKDKKLISRGLSLIPHQYAQTGSKVAETLGLGKRRVGRPRKTTVRRAVGRKTGISNTMASGFRVGRGGAFRVGPMYGRGVRRQVIFP